MSSGNRNHRIRFMENNFASLNFGQATYSSQLDDFPFSNAVGNKFRTKTWKPSGYFEITATNNLLYINDGSDKTITVTVQGYATPVLLAAEIQTQLNAVSSDWTVSYNSGNCYRFKIENASGHTLQLSNRTNAIYETIGFVQSTDIALSSPATALQQRNHTSEWAKFDLGYNQKITFIGLVSPLTQYFNISRSAVVKIQANNIDDFSTVPFEKILTVSDGGILAFLDETEDTAFRFWKIEVVDKYNSSGPEAMEFSVIYLGDHLTLDDRNIANGFRKKVVDNSIKQVSESGVMYFTEKPKYTVFENAGIQFLSKDDREKLEKMFQTHGTHTPFFLSIDPTLCISKELHDLTKYVVFDDEPSFTHVIRDLFNMSIEFREVI